LLKLKLEAYKPLFENVVTGDPVISIFDGLIDIANNIRFLLGKSIIMR